MKPRPILYLESGLMLLEMGLLGWVLRVAMKPRPILYLDSGLISECVWILPNGVERGRPSVLSSLLRLPSRTLRCVLSSVQQAA
jgi:hypothetical protein